MSKRFLMGNEAIALGAIHAGVHFVSGYPGTPSTEILESVAKWNSSGNIYVEWSVNEKAALEVAAGAAYAGASSLVTMKQVGLNVASDPLMSLAYVGIKGSMVIVSADDPGPISSQTEQDTRHFAQFSKLPVFDPSSPEEAYEMIQDAFAYSRKYQTPVLFRPTTRICHGCASIDVNDTPTSSDAPEGFVKDTNRWVIFPRTSYLNHLKIEKRNEELRSILSNYPHNFIEGSGRVGIACGGVSYSYVKEALQDIPQEIKLLKVSTPHPFPEDLALQFMQGTNEILVVEELDPVIEQELTFLCGKHHLPDNIHGKLTHEMPQAGENSTEIVKAGILAFLGIEPMPAESSSDMPPLPVRPPVLCAGCPHRASFYAVKKAMHGKKAVFCGDIGCYTLGNAMPLDMVDTCLCMGADVTIAQGLHRIEPDAVNFAFIGDSTFFASGITGVVNAVYNQTDIVLVILDNSTTAMTGHQPHPGTGRTMMGNISSAVSAEKILRAIGVSNIKTVDPFDYELAVKTVSEIAEYKGVRAIIFKAPCISVASPQPVFHVDSGTCIQCGKCLRELGCPAIVKEDGKISIEPTLCYGCSLCAQICPTGSIIRRCSHEN